MTDINMTDKDTISKTWKKDKPYPLCEHLPKNIIKEMEKDSIETQKDGLERGFFICSSARYYQDMNENNTKISEKRKGEEGEIDLDIECPPNIPNIKKVGMFHTHYRLSKNFPSYADQSLPSYADSFNAKFSVTKFYCIGSHDKIRCTPSAGNPYPPNPLLEGTKLQKVYDIFRRRWKEKAVGCTIMI